MKAKATSPAARTRAEIAEALRDFFPSRTSLEPGAEARLRVRGPRRAGAPDPPGDRGSGQDLFLAQGYAATTIDAIAEAAQVSRRTMFASVGGKAVLLKLVLEWAIVGDGAEPVALAKRSGIQALRAESDPRRRLETWVRIVVDVATRVAPIVDVITAAADGDPVAREMLAVSEEQRTAGARAFVANLASVGGLPPTSPSSRRPTCAGRTWTPPSTGDWSCSAAGPLSASPTGLPSSSPPPCWLMKPGRLPDAEPGDGLADEHALDFRRALEDGEVVRRDLD